MFELHGAAVNLVKVEPQTGVRDIGKMITTLAQRKIQTLLDKGEYRAVENATVLVNDRGHAAIVNSGGAFYWVDNKALAREFDAAEPESPQATLIED